MVPQPNTTVKVKVKLSLCLTKHHAMKTYWRGEGIAPRILDHGTKRRLVVSFTSRSLYRRGNSPRCPLYRRLGGPQSQSGHGKCKAVPVFFLTEHHTMRAYWGSEGMVEKRKFEVLVRSRNPEPRSYSPYQSLYRINYPTFQKANQQDKCLEL
jgi:hypothetical protein